MKTIITSIFAMAVLLLTSSAYALLVSPLPKVEIPKGEKAATLRITDDDHTWQAYVYRVEQSEDGKETLIESEDIIVYPTVFKAPRSLKLVLNRPVDRSAESYYRIIVRQINVDKGTGVKALLELSIPVFVKAEKENISKRIICGDSITIENSGNTHLKFIVNEKAPLYVMQGKTITIQKVSLKDEDGKEYCGGINL